MVLIAETRSIILALIDQQVSEEGVFLFLRFDLIILQLILKRQGQKRPCLFTCQLSYRTDKLRFAGLLTI